MLFSFSLYITIDPESAYRKKKLDKKRTFDSDYAQPFPHSQQAP